MDIGLISVIIKRNTPIPYEETKVTTIDNQGNLLLDFLKSKIFLKIIYYLINVILINISIVPKSKVF